GVEINSASQGTSPLDWKHALDLDPYGSFGDLVQIGDDKLDFTGRFVRATGRAHVAIADFVTGAVGFTYQQQGVDVDVDAGGTFDPLTAANAATVATRAGGPDLHDATLTLLALEILPDDHDSSNGAEGLRIGITGGPGIKIASGSLAVAIVTPKPGDVAGDTRQWLALTAGVGGGSL